MFDRYVGIQSLRDPLVFEAHYSLISDTLASLFHRGCRISAENLSAAFSDWVNQRVTDADRQRIPLISFVGAVGGLVSACSKYNIVQYPRKEFGNEEEVANFSLRRFPNEITALAFAAVVYSLEIMRISGQDPSCPLTRDQLETAAHVVRRGEFRAHRLRLLLKLRPIRAV